MILKEDERKEMRKIIIETQKLTNKKLKRKREEEEIKNQKTKKVRKTKLTAAELGSKGFINKDLVNQLTIITKGDEKIIKKIIIEIQVCFAKYVEKMHRAFWQRHYNHLQNEGIDNNAIIKENRNTGDS